MKILGAAKKKTTGAMPAAKKKRAWVVLLFTLFAVGTFAAFVCVWMRLQAIEYGYKLSEATKEHLELVEANRRLKVEIALLKNPNRVARIADEKLGLKTPGPEQIRRLPLPPDMRIITKRKSGPALVANTGVGQ
ncbi:MAG: cell division protein FtsL [Pseudomonadota bacterium]